MFLGTIVYAVINSVILILMSIEFNLTFGISGVSNFAYGAIQASHYKATVVFDEKKTTVAKIMHSLVSGGFPVRGEPQFLN